MVYSQSEHRTTLKWYILGPLIAIAGGIFGILAAAYQESGYGWYIGPILAAPFFEESIKPCGVYFLLAKKPEALPSQLYTALLAALAGISFAIIENILYLEVFVPDHAHSLVVWRFTVCILLHASCSFIVGFGINQKLIDWVNGEVHLLGSNRKFFILAMVIHGSYNGLAILLENKLDWF